MAADKLVPLHFNLTPFPLGKNLGSSHTAHSSLTNYRQPRHSYSFRGITNISSVSPSRTSIPSGKLNQTNTPWAESKRYRDPPWSLQSRNITWEIPKSTKNEARAVSDLCCSAQQPWDARIHAAASCMPGRQDCIPAQQPPLPAWLLHYLHA